MSSKKFLTILFLLFVITLPLEATAVLEIGFTIRLSYIFLALLIFFAVYTRKKWSFKSPLTVPIFIFLIINLLSLAVNIYSSPPEIALAEVVKYRGSLFRPVIQLLFLFFFVSAYFLTLQICANKIRWQKVLKVFIGVSLVVSVYAIYQFIAANLGLPFVDITNALSTGGGAYEVFHATGFTFRSHATFQEPSCLGHYLLSILPLLLMMYIYRIKRRVAQNSFLKIGFLPVLVMITALLLTQSRGAWFGFGAALLFLFLVTKIRYKIKLIGIVILATILLSFLLFVCLPGAYQAISHDVMSRWTYNRKLPSGDFGLPYLDVQRVEFYPYIFDLWQQYPVLGVGLGNYGFYAAEHFGKSLIVGANSTWLRVLAETGLLGLLALCLLVFTFYRTMLSTLRRVKNTPWYPYLLGFSASFTGMMAHYLVSGDCFNLYFWFFLGLSVAAIKIIRQENQRMYESNSNNTNS